MAERTYGKGQMWANERTGVSVVLVDRRNPGWRVVVIESTHPSYPVGGFDLYWDEEHDLAEAEPYGAASTTINTDAKGFLTVDSMCKDAHVPFPVISTFRCRTCSATRIDDTWVQVCFHCRPARPVSAYAPSRVLVCPVHGLDWNAPRAVGSDAPAKVEVPNAT